MLHNTSNELLSIIFLLVFDLVIYIKQVHNALWLLYNKCM